MVFKSKIWTYKGGRRPVIKKIMARISPTTNTIHAMFIAIPAIPVSPNTPAAIAIIKNVAAQLIILYFSLKFGSIKAQDLE